MTEIIHTKTSLNFTFGVLTFCGMWMPPSYAGTWKARLYGIFTLFSYAGTIMFYLVTEMIDIFVNLGDMEKNIETSILAITMFSAAVKTINIIINRQRIQRIVDKLDEPNFTRVRKANSKHLLKAMMFTNVCSKLLPSMAICTILLWGAFPLFDKSDKLPLRAWFPWDTSVRSTYITLYIYQFVSIGLIGAFNCSIDALVCSIVLLICGQLDVLHAEISVLGTYNQESGKKIDEMDSVTRPDNLGDGLREASDAKSQLRRCVLHQKDIIEYIKEVESLFSGAIFVQFLVSCIVICVTAFQLGVTKFSVEFMSQLVYLSTILVEVSFYCYPGNELILKSARISEAAYQSPWYDQDLEFKKMLLLVMERSKRPITVTAGRILPLSLQTLTSILRSSYSYYAVLNSVHDV